MKDTNESTGDSPAVAKRRKRDARTVSLMISMYCDGNHAGPKSQQAYCGEPLCAECAEIDAYAVKRTFACRNMAAKSSCENCPHQCYRAKERAAIREIMRYAGPRMITKHPIAAIRHLLGK